MNNFLKVPLPEYAEEVIKLFNNALATYKDWDGLTTVKSIVVQDISFTITLSKSDGTESTKEDIMNVHEILNSLGFVYEYNF